MHCELKKGEVPIKIGYNNIIKIKVGDLIEKSTLWNFQFSGFKKKELFICG